MSLLSFSSSSFSPRSSKGKGGDDFPPSYKSARNTGEFSCEGKYSTFTTRTFIHTFINSLNKQEEKMKIKQ